MTAPVDVAFRRLSAITVTFNSATFVLGALESIEVAAREAALELEMIVIDNASSDDSAELVTRHFPAARLERNTENVGFGAANNRAFEMATGDLWLLVNPDAVLQPTCARVLAGFLAAHPRAAAAAPSIQGSLGMGPESAGMSPGIRSAAGHFLLLNRLLPGTRGGPWQGWQLAHRPWLGPRRVDWVGGTVMAVRPEAIRAVGGFDPSFFLYFEDVNLGERLRRDGWQLWLVPDARAWHQISHGRVSTRWLDALHEYYADRAGAGQVALLSFIVALGLAIRSAWRVVGARTAAERAEARRARANATHAIELLWASLRARRPSNRGS